MSTNSERITYHNQLIDRAKNKADALPGRYTPAVQELTVIENGIYTAPEGVDGYSPVIVNVQSSGGSGGGSVETCTVNVRMTKDVAHNYAATCVDNGAIVAKTDTGVHPRFGGGSGVEEITVENVVCGSAFSLYSFVALSFNEITNATQLFTHGSYGYWFLITAPDGGTVTLDAS